MHTVTYDVRPAEDPRLRRAQVHDSRSWDYPAFPGAMTLPRTLIDHKRVVPAFDQGEIGCCTADAAYGCLMTEPLHRASWAFDQAACVELYKLETQMDNVNIPGVYPPDDTGSSGLWSAKALRKLGYIRSWRTAFTLTSALTALVVQPISVGLWWPAEFMNPRADGVLKLNRRPRYVGGHQIEINGWDPTRQLVRIAQSWGPDWGDKGYGYVSSSDLGRLLDDGGDVTVFGL